MCAYRLDASNDWGVIAMQEHKDFWDKNAGRYGRFMRKERVAYEEMYELIRPVLKASFPLTYAECEKTEV